MLCLSPLGVHFLKFPSLPASSPSPSSTVPCLLSPPSLTSSFPPFSLTALPALPTAWLTSCPNHLVCLYYLQHAGTSQAVGLSLISTRLAPCFHKLPGHLTFLPAQDIACLSFILPHQTTPSYLQCLPSHLVFHLLSAPAHTDFLCCCIFCFLMTSHLPPFFVLFTTTTASPALTTQLAVIYLLSLNCSSPLLSSLLLVVLSSSPFTASSHPG